MKKSEINILIVEDDSALREALSEAVRRAGFTVLAVGKPEDAISTLKLKTVHLAVVDCLLPKKNGVELVVEMRQSAFRDGRVVMMSGVFKDKNFEADAIMKTNAVAFLAKPFDLGKLKDLIEEEMRPLIDMGTVPLNVLVSRPYSSPRERVKVIESLNEIRAFDLPFVMSILLDSQMKGHINLANEAGEVFGVSIRDGQVVSVDSSGSLADLSLLVVQKGFISLDDLKEMSKNGLDGDFLENLVKSSLLSPHNLAEIRKAHMINELQRLFLDQVLTISFVASDVPESASGVGWMTLIESFYRVLTSDIPAEHLKEFYHDWLDFPIRVSPSFSKESKAFSLPIFKKLPFIVDAIDKGLTLEELIAKDPGQRDLILRAVHLLTLCRQILFDDVKKVRSFEVQMRHMQSLHDELKDKNPMQVFQYFGAGENPRNEDVARIYKDFARTNHPDKLPAHASAEAQKLFNTVFSILSEAHDVLTDNNKRERFIVDMKQQEAKRQIQAEALADEGLIKLRRGKVQDAIKELSEAFKLSPTRNIKLYLFWAHLKTKLTPENLAKIAAEIDAIHYLDKRDALYYHVFGMLKKAQGDKEGASAQFDKALTVNPEWIDSRRELSALESEKGSKKSNSLLTGDISDIVTGLFKRKTK